VELVIVIFILPILIWAVAISALFGGKGKIILMRSYFPHSWRDASEWLTGLRFTRLISTLLFDVWADIFSVANMERFLHSRIAKVLFWLRMVGGRASEAVEVVSARRRSSGTGISWEYFVEIYLQDKWEKQHGGEAYGR